MARSETRSNRVDLWVGSAEAIKQLCNQHRVGRLGRHGGWLGLAVARLGCIRWAIIVSRQPFALLVWLIDFGGFLRVNFGLLPSVLVSSCSNCHACILRRIWLDANGACGQTCSIAGASAYPYHALASRVQVFVVLLGDCDDLPRTHA
eukprot:6177417-Pleurochrysis_carterae.AAC.8